MAHGLLGGGVELRLISSLALARTREAITYGWDKNVPKDAQIILHMLRIGHVQRYCDPLAHGLVDVQELSKTHEAISKAKTEIWHRLLTHDLPLYFPEAERFRGNARSDWFLAFLEMFPTPATIVALDKESFVESLQMPFSSSSAFSRFVSETSIPPNLALPRVERRRCDPAPLSWTPE